MLPKNWYISSTGDGLSLTVKGLSIGGFLPVIIAVAGILRAFGVDISDDAATQFAMLGVFGVSIVTTIVGLTRKAARRA